MIIQQLKQDLSQYANEKRKKSNEWFFKTGKGEYGEGDKFIGVAMPDIRRVVKKYVNLDFPLVSSLLASEIHEERMTGVLILTERAKRYARRKDLAELKNISDFYLANRQGINNWDLVDVSCHHVLGQAILHDIYTLDLLDGLADSGVLWDRRISMVTTFALIRTGNIIPTLVLAEKLLGDKEDLMHKAIGWMLREAWKRKPADVEDFLMENYHQLARTTLRYAIEKMPEVQRKEFLYLYKKNV